MRRARVIALALVTGAAAAGCSMPSLSAAPVTPPTAAATTSPATARAQTPASAGATAGHASPLAVAQATHEYPSPPVHERAAAPARDPVGAVRAFATAYINWDAHSVAGDMAGLAARSIGQARSAMALAAVQTGSDYELARGGVANHGTVEAIAPLPGRPGAFAVVTLERTTATSATTYAGLAPAWHVAVATVAELSAGAWVVSSWQPEN